MSFEHYSKILNISDIFDIQFVKVEVEQLCQIIGNSQHLLIDNSLPTKIKVSQWRLLYERKSLIQKKKEFQSLVNLNDYLKEQQKSNDLPEEQYHKFIKKTCSDKRLKFCSKWFFDLETVQKYCHSVEGGVPLDLQSLQFSNLEQEYRSMNIFEIDQIPFQMQRSQLIPRFLRSHRIRGIKELRLNHTSLDSIEFVNYVDTANLVVFEAENNHIVSSKPLSKMVCPNLEEVSLKHNKISKHQVSRFLAEEFFTKLDFRFPADEAQSGCAFDPQAYFKVDNSKAYDPSFILETAQAPLSIVNPKLKRAVKLKIPYYKYRQDESFREDEDKWVQVWF